MSSHFFTLFRRLSKLLSLRVVFESSWVVRASLVTSFTGFAGFYRRFFSASFCRSDVGPRSELVFDDSLVSTSTTCST